MESQHHTKGARRLKFSVSPRLAQITQEFLDGGGKFESFRIGDLFTIRPTSSYKMTNLDLFKEKGKTPVVTNTSVNNGISGWVNLKPTESGGIITYSDTTTSDGIFYQPNDFVGYSHIQGLYPFQPNLWDENSMLYFICAFKKTAAGRFDYANKFNRAIASELRVILPVYSNEIDFDFMRRYIATLKAERVATLKAYLQAAGLSETILTEGELAALDALRQNRVELKPFMLKEIFSLEKGKRLTKADMLPGELNYIGAISVNNGIRQKIRNGKIWRPNCITVNYNGSVGYSYYQENPFHASDDVNILYLREGDLKRNIALYFCASLFKISRNFSYSDKWTLDKMEISILYLPVDSQRHIDYEFIHNLISAQIKLAISNMLDSKDLEIGTTEQVIQN